MFFMEGVNNFSNKIINHSAFNVTKLNAEITITLSMLNLHAKTLLSQQIEIKVEQLIQSCTMQNIYPKQHDKPT